ncbi:MAG: hypothetical protein AAF799_40655 [Myxococcota bacterium]
MLLVAAHALVRMGACVEIDATGENLVERIDPKQAEEAQERADPPIVVRVRAEGLPNLLHELVHAVQTDRLDDDHGIDYSAIPFDLDSKAGRAVLWDELACCVISCAYLWSHGRAARTGGSFAQVRAEVEAWFREQVEIQPVFYGMEDSPRAFVARVGDLLHRYAHEVDAAIERAYALTERALRHAGAQPQLASAPHRPTPQSLWPLLA